MLAEERFSRILNIIDSMGSATVQQLMDELDASESTIRRDLVAMDKKGYLTKVHGGAISNNSNIHTQDENFTSRQIVNHDEKEEIAKYAASLIKNHDFVYIDAGTTTELMINYIEAQDAVFVTNSLTNAKKLSEKGYTVYILGGEFKSITEAIVGDEAVFELDKYNFTKGFWGANGINGYSCAAEPPVQYRLSHLSRRSEPLIKHTICMMRIYSRNALSNPYTSRMEISCSASMLVMLMR